MDEKDRLAFFRKVIKRNLDKANEADIPDEPKLRLFGFLLTEPTPEKPEDHNEPVKKPVAKTQSFETVRSLQRRLVHQPRAAKQRR